jgi:hypothetical protein
MFERENQQLTSQFTSIIRELEQKLKAIETALEALSVIDDTTPPDWVTGTKPASASPAKPRKRFSAETRRKMAESQRLRYKKARGEAV